MVPNNSPIIRSIDTGDAEAVTQLFRSRLASPFDRDENNRSLLQVKRPFLSNARTILIMKRALFDSSRRGVPTIRALLEWTPPEVINDKTVGFT